MKRIGRIPELTTKAKLILGLTVFLLLGALITLIVTSMIANQMISGGETYSFKDKEPDERKLDATKAAQSATNSGDSKKAAAIYEQAIKDEPDPTKKVELAIVHSRMLKGAGKGDEAIEVAKKAEDYSEDKYLITDWLAQLYEHLGRYDEAAEYYKKAGTLAGSPTNIGRFDKTFYDNEAIRVKKRANNG